MYHLTQTPILSSVPTLTTFYIARAVYEDLCFKGPIFNFLEHLLFRATQNKRSGIHHQSYAAHMGAKVINSRIIRYEALKRRLSQDTTPEGTVFSIRVGPIE